jgi:hypothetical protein
LHSLNILLQYEPSASDDRPILLRKLLRTVYRAMDVDDFAVARVDRGLRHFLAYQAENAEPLLARVDTLVQIADWAYSGNRKSYEQVLCIYQQAYDLLERRSRRRRALSSFAPATQSLPSFLG